MQTTATTVYEVQGTSLRMTADSAVDNTGAKRVWDAALVLGAYFNAKNNKKLVEGKSIVELGAGLGYLTSLLAILGGNVCSTEMDDMLVLLQRNVSTALSFAVNDGKTVGTTSVCKLDWTTCAVDVPALTPEPPYDLIVGADVVYNEKYLPAFIATIDLLLEESPRAQVYVAVDVRDEGLVRRFEAALAEQLRLAVKVIPKKKLPEPYNGPDWVHATVYHARRRAPGGAAAGEACG